MISIITVCYNSEATIRQTIESVISQDYEKIQYIIIDGGSTDQTLKIIKQFPEAVDKCVSEPDRGVYDAMNKGISQANGDLIAFLNADDIYAYPQAVRDMVNLIINDKVDAAYADLMYVDRYKDNKIVRKWKTGPYKTDAFRYGWVPPHPTFFCKKSVYKELGVFDTNFEVAADFELMLRFIEKNSLKTAYLPRYLVKMRTGGKANQVPGIARGNRDILRAFSKHKIKPSPLYFLIKPVTKALQYILK